MGFGDCSIVAPTLWGHSTLYGVPPDLCKEDEVSGHVPPITDPVCKLGLECLTSPHQLDRFQVKEFDILRLG
jgi:hypothetical protein